MANNKYRMSVDWSACDTYNDATNTGGKATGIQWVKLGMRTFFKQPLALAGLFFMFMAVMSVLSIVPVLGNALALALLPAATLGLMAATLESTRGKFPMPSILISAFRAGQRALSVDTEDFTQLGMAGEVVANDVLSCIEECLLATACSAAGCSPRLCSPGMPGVATLATCMDARLSRLINGAPGSSSIMRACKLPAQAGKGMTGLPCPWFTPAKRADTSTSCCKVNTSGPQASRVSAPVPARCKLLTTALATSSTHTG